MNKQIAKGRIRKARLEDIEYIHQWLQQQENANIDGSFLCNWNMTLESFKDGELIVFVESSTSKAIAYQWGALTSPGILEVRADSRSKGIGKRLVEYRIKQASRKGICALRIQCKPASSIPFWRKMGFELYKDDSNYAYKILEQQLEQQLVTSKHGIEADVTVRLYPNSRQWDKNTPPSREFSQKATLGNDGIVYLSKRICIPDIARIWAGDVVVEIIVNGRLLYIDKAKYKKAQQIGVARFTNGYSIERIYLNEKLA